MNTETVTWVHHWTDKTFSFKTTRNQSFRFKNSEFAMIGLIVDDKPLLRAYSIASANYEDHIEFLSIKVPDGPLTSRLQHLKVGDEVVCMPKCTGTLTIDNLTKAKDLYLLSTGTGIAPFMSIIRDPETYKLYWSDPANVEKVVVNESKGKDIECYYIKNLEANFDELAATSAARIHARPYGAGGGMLSGGNIGASAGNYQTTTGDTGANYGSPVDATHVVHMSLTEGMDHNWPFGISILEPIFKVFKQKELLEDSIIIYRVHRAPERRVFFIDVGNMPPHKAQQYLERVKYEVQQKRVPNKNKDGQNVADAAYNPMSMLEGFQFIFYL